MGAVVLCMIFFLTETSISVSGYPQGDLSNNEVTVIAVSENEQQNEDAKNSSQMDQSDADLGIIPPDNEGQVPQDYQGDPIPDGVPIEHGDDNQAPENDHGDHNLENVQDDQPPEKGEDDQATESEQGDQNIKNYEDDQPPENGKDDQAPEGEQGDQNIKKYQDDQPPENGQDDQAPEDERGDQNADYIQENQAPEDELNQSTKIDQGSLTLDNDKDHKGPEDNQGDQSLEMEQVGETQEYDQDSQLENEPNDMPLGMGKLEPGYDMTKEEIIKFKLWNDAMIPYYIDVTSFKDKVLRDTIRSFLSSVNSLTSLNFVELPIPPNDNSRYVFFINRRGLLGCADHSIQDFTNSGVQKVVLGYDCLSKENELAEAVLAIAGIPPMHNAPNRDNYIKVNENNIMPDKKYLFRKLKNNEWLFHNLDYDFRSAGHYHSHKYSKNGHATIEVQNPDIYSTTGEAKVLSPYDILKIRMLYNYMVRNKRPQAPGCHKLFEPGSKFNQYKPTNTIKPRQKPKKYLNLVTNVIQPGEQFDNDMDENTNNQGGPIYPTDQVESAENDDNEYNMNNDGEKDSIITNKNVLPNAMNSEILDPAKDDDEYNMNYVGEKEPIITDNNDLPSAIHSETLDPAKDDDEYNMNYVGEKDSIITDNNDLPSAINSETLDPAKDDNKYNMNSVNENDPIISDNNDLPNAINPETIDPAKNDDEYIMNYVGEDVGPPIIQGGNPENLKLKTLDKKNPIADMSDFNSDEIRTLSLKVSKTSKKPNEISYLSDFQTSDEANRYNKVRDIQKKTIEYSKIYEIRDDRRPIPR